MPIARVNVAMNSELAKKTYSGRSSSLSATGLSR